MTSLEATYRAYIACLNERRWSELGTYLHSEFTKNAKTYTPETYAADLQANGDTSMTIDSITLDDQNQTLASTTLTTWKPTGQVMGLTPPAGKPLLFMEQNLNIFLDGKLSQIHSIPDRTGIQRQLSDPDFVYAPDLVSNDSHTQSPPPPSTTPPHPALDPLYRLYISHINARTPLSTAWPPLLHPLITYDGTPYPQPTYIARMEAVLAAIPDLHVNIHTLVADDEKQRVAVRLESSGTPKTEEMGKGLEGVEKTGEEGKRFAEHLTYGFRGGRVERVWSLADWGGYGDLMGGS